MSTGPGGSENLQTGEAVARIPDQLDAIRWGQSKSGYVPAGGRDDYADRAGLPRLPQSQNGLEHLDAAFAQSKRGVGVRSGPIRHPTARLPAWDESGERPTGVGDPPATSTTASDGLATLAPVTGISGDFPGDRSKPRGVGLWLS